MRSVQFTADGAYDGYPGATRRSSGVQRRREGRHSRRRLRKTGFERPNAHASLPERRTTSQSMQIDGPAEIGRHRPAIGKRVLVETSGGSIFYKVASRAALLRWLVFYSCATGQKACGFGRSPFENRGNWLGLARRPL